MDATREDGDTGIAADSAPSGTGDGRSHLTRQDGREVRTDGDGCERVVSPLDGECL